MHEQHEAIKAIALQFPPLLELTDRTLVVRLFPRLLEKYSENGQPSLGHSRSNTWRRPYLIGRPSTDAVCERDSSDLFKASTHDSRSS